MILLFILMIALLAIWIGHALTHPPKMSDYEEDSRARQKEEDLTDV